MNQVLVQESARLVTEGKVPVIPGFIEKELVRIWREAAASDVEQEKIGGAAEITARVRARLSNVVILVARSENSLSDRTIDDLITSLCISHPSRFFIIGYEPGRQIDDSVDGIQLRTAVSSRCVRASSGAHVCSEEIYIATGEDGIPAVPNLLLSLLVADVGAMLLILSDPALSKSEAGKKFQPNVSWLKLISALGRICDRVIYDSCAFSNYLRSIECIKSCDSLVGINPPQDSIDQISGTYGSSGQETIVNDLNWSRARRWRELVASQFDARSISESVLSTSKIKLSFWSDIEDSSKIIIPGETLLLASWFVAKLAWNFTQAKLETTENGKLFRCKSSQNQDVVLEFERVEQPKWLTSSNGQIGDRFISIPQCRLAVLDIQLTIEGRLSRVGIQRIDRDNAAISLAQSHQNQSHENKKDQDLWIDRSLRRVSFLSDSLDTLVHANLTAVELNADYEEVVRGSLTLANLLS